jgi:hypothetical protein
VTDFVSLTAALAGWFDKPLAELPDRIRERIHQDFFPLSWDSLTTEQRQSVARQWDHHNDPATETDRQFWWDFFSKKGVLEEQIEQWQSVVASTAGELTQKECRLKELKDELARMQRYEECSPSDLLPTASESVSAAPNQTGPYIAYPKALRRLVERMNATPEELAVWISIGPNLGGIVAYRNANELSPPPRFYFDYFMGEDYLAPLMACWFLENDIENFNPTDRFITGQALIERWSTQQGVKPVALIQAKIEESRLLDLHPTFGGTRGANSEDNTFPPLEAGLFQLSHVHKIEEEDFGCTAEKDRLQPPVGSPEWRSQTARNAANTRHDQPGGSRDKQRQIRDIWASGKYSSRDRCAEEECAALNMSISAARRALRNTPDPTPST